jgi:hypothetical protein
MALGISQDRAVQALLGKQDQDLMDSAVSAGASPELLGSVFNALAGPNVNYDTQSGNLTTRGPQRQGTPVPPRFDAVKEVAGANSRPVTLNMPIPDFTQERYSFADDPMKVQPQDPANIPYNFTEFTNLDNIMFGIQNPFVFNTAVEPPAPTTQEQLEKAMQEGTLRDVGVVPVERGIPELANNPFVPGQGTVLQEPDKRAIINQTMSQAGVPQLDKQILGAIQPVINPAEAQPATQTVSEFLAQRDIPTPRPTLPEGVQPGSPQAAFLEMQQRGLLTDEEIKKGELLAERMGTTFSPETGFSRDPFLQAQEQQAQVDASRQASLMGRPMEGQSYAQFMRYEDQPIQRTEQFVEPGTGRLRRRATPEATRLMREAGFDIPEGVQPLAPEYMGAEMASQELQGRLEQRAIERERERNERLFGTPKDDTELSFGDAKKQAKSELIQRGFKDPTAQQINAVARGLQQEAKKEPVIFEQSGKLLITDKDGVTRSLGNISDGVSLDDQVALRKLGLDIDRFNYEQEQDKLERDELKERSKIASIYKVGDLLRQNAVIQRAAEQAGKDAGLLTAGPLGLFFSFVPGSKAFDQAKVIKTLQADAAFSTLQALRDSNESGASGLGQVSNIELDLLMNSRTALAQGQSPERFRENLKAYMEQRKRSLMNVYDAFIISHGEEAANQAFKVSNRDELSQNLGGDGLSEGLGTSATSTTVSDPASGENYTVEQI